MKISSLAKSFLILTSTLTLAACGASNGSTSNDVALEILEGEYVTTPDLSSTSEKNGYLALKVKLSNKSKATLKYVANNFSLTNQDDETSEPEMIFDSQNSFKTLEYGNIKKGKSAVGYLVYEVNKDEMYELSVDNLFTSKEEIETDISIKVDASQYDDNSKKVTELAEAFVNQTFLDGTVAEGDSEAVSSTGDEAVVTKLSNTKSVAKDKKATKDSKWKLSNNTEEDRAAYVESFTTSIKSWYFSYFKPSDKQIKTFVEQYIAANAKRAQVEYSVKSYLPSAAIVTVTPKVLDLSSLNTDSLKEDYLKTQPNEDDYVAFNKGWEQYLFENIHKRYDSVEIATPDYMPTGGYELRLTRDSDTGEWKVDTSKTDANYTYEELTEAFQGEDFN